MTTEKIHEHLVPVRPHSSREHSRIFGLSTAEQELYLRAVADSLQIRTHYELFLWLQGEMQQLLPHEILLSAWGDFVSPRLNFDIVSRIPGVRTAELRHCDIDAFLTKAHQYWVKDGRNPTLTHAAEFASVLRPNCNCQTHAALRTMRSLTIHGVRDERSSLECVYIALYSGSLSRGRPKDKFRDLVDSLIALIDVAFRKIGMLRSLPVAPASQSKSEWLDLSIREREILDLVCRGSTNVTIAANLSISPYTVKNHVQRIFRKIGASNRTEAAAKYNQAIQALAKCI